MRNHRELLTGQDGASAVGFAILAPVMIIVLLVILTAGRLSLAGNAVEAAAASAARDASLARDPWTAQRAAQAAASRSLSQAGTRCQMLGAATDTSGLNAPLGQIGVVRVTVTCTARLSDIGLPGLPGEKTYTSTQISPVDPYRQR